MRTTWFIQSNLNAIESQKMQTACEAMDYPVKLFKLIPFDTKMPRLGATDPFILIGSTTLNRNALASTKYRKGIFFNTNFKPTCYSAGYGLDFLNSDLAIWKLKDFPDDHYCPDTEIFIRSNDDSKDVSGGTCLVSDLTKIKQNTEAHWIGGDIFGPESEIVISSVKQIYSEYRFIVCNGEIIGKSQYRPTVSHGVPQDVIDFARVMIAKWRPHDIFVIDICETNNGFKVVECNCVNGSGWYHADYGNIIYHLSNYQETKYL